VSQKRPFFLEENTLEHLPPQVWDFEFAREVFTKKVLVRVNILTPR
jgi:hypothetical protein